MSRPDPNTLERSHFFLQLSGDLGYLSAPEAYCMQPVVRRRQRLEDSILEVRRLDIADVLEIRPKKHGDHRGFFSETWSRAAFAAIGCDLDFVQDNHSLSVQPGTLRGLHFQTPPFAQAKLVRVVHGAIFDVAVDIRKGSPNFARWTAIELSSERWNQLLVPAGFAHGFVTLTADTEVVYKVDAPYSPDHDRSIRYDDPAIGVVWPDLPQPFELSAKDRNAPLLSEIDTGFTYR